MKITLVSSVFPYPRRGVFVGIERLIEEYSRALISEGHEVNIITTFWNGGIAEEEYRGINIYRVGDSSQSLGKIGRLFDLHYSTFGKNVLKCEKAFINSDVVHAISTLTITRWLKEKGIPTVSQFNHKGEIRQITDYLTLPFHIQSEKKAYNNSNAVFTMSRINKEILVRDYGVRKDLIKVIPPGVDINKFRGTKEKEDKSLLFVGPLIKRKGLEYLIKSFKEIENRDIKLILIGEGRERKNLEFLVRRLGLKNVEFKGYLEEEKLIEHYNMADMFVFPSLKEGFGQVLLEAMACGLPIISTNTSAIPEVVGDAGILVEPRDSQALANAINLLIEDKELRNKLGGKGKKRVGENFTWKKVTERTLDAYREIIGKG